LFDGFDISEAQQQQTHVDTATLPLADNTTLSPEGMQPEGFNNFEYIKIPGLRSYICSFCSSRVGEGSEEAHR